MAFNPSSTYLADLILHPKIYGTDLLPIAGFFTSVSSIGISSTSTGSHQTLAGDPYSIGIVGRSNAPGTAVKTSGFMEKVSVTVSESWEC